MTSSFFSRPLVLVVDDSAVNRKLTSAQLTRLGCDVVVASSGQEGIDQIAANRPDLVFLDWHMPPPDGLQTARILRRSEARSNARPLLLVALTAQAMLGDRETCLSAGMNDFLPRPVRLADLQRILNRWIQEPSRAGAPEATALDRLTGSAAQTEQIQVCNPAMMADLVDELGDRELVRMLVQTYVKELASRIDVVILSSDPIDQRRALHTLKTTSALLGGEQLAALAQRLEEESIARGPEPSQELALSEGELRSLARQTAIQLQRCSQTLEASVSSGLDRAGSD